MDVPADYSAALEADLDAAIAEYENTGQIKNKAKNDALNGLLSEGIITLEELDVLRAYTDAELYQELQQIKIDHGPCTEPDNCSMTLTWSYEVDATTTSFQIYRSREPSPLAEYKSLDIGFFFTGSIQYGSQSFSWQDTAIDPGKRYIYKVQAVHSDGGFSELSSPLTTIAQ